MKFEVITKNNGKSHFTKTGRNHIMYLFLLTLINGDAEQAYNIEEWAYICNHGETFESNDLIVKSI